MTRELSRCALVLCFVHVAALAAFVPTEPQSGPTILIRVGRIDVQVPAPPGFVPLAHRDNPKWRFLQEAGRANAGGIKEIWYPPEAAEQTRRGEEPDATRWFTLAILREAVAMDQKGFASLKRTLREQHDELMREAARRLQPDIDASAPRYGKELGLRGFTMKMDEPMPLGIVDDREDRIATMLLHPATVTAEGETAQDFVASVSYLVLVKGHVLVLSAYTLVTSAADLDMTKRGARRWVEAVVVANQLARKK